MIDVDSYIRRVVLATEGITATQRVTNPIRGHKEVRRSTGDIMVTTRYSNHTGSKSLQNPNHV